MFHWMDGWFFKREDDGAVRIEKRTEAKGDAPLVLGATIPSAEWASIVCAVSTRGESDGRWFQALDFHEGRNADYILTGHQCKPVARLKMGEGRDWWLGELTEPIPEWPTETHCLHIKTPLKEVVLGVTRGDMEQLAVLCQIVCGPINTNWLERMAIVFQKRAEPLRE